jgi:hypothetical protein
LGSFGARVWVRSAHRAWVRSARELGFVRRASLGSFGARAWVRSARRRDCQNGSWVRSARALRIFFSVSQSIGSRFWRAELRFAPSVRTERWTLPIIRREALGPWTIPGQVRQPLGSWSLRILKERRRGRRQGISSIGCRPKFIAKLANSRLAKSKSPHQRLEDRWTDLMPSAAQRFSEQMRSRRRGPISKPRSYHSCSHDDFS